MKHGIWLPNIKRYLSGSLVGPSPTLNVSVLNTVPVPVATTLYSFKERRFMDCAVTSIPASGSAWIQIGDTNFPAADIANTIAEIRISANLGSALTFGKGPNAGSVTEIATSAAGQTLALGVSLVATDKVWVRALQNATVDSGELLVLFLGA